VLVSAWFAIPAVTTLVTNVGLVWARRAAAGAPTPEPARRLPDRARPSAGVSVQEFRELYPRFDQIGVVFSTCFVILAVVCLVMATAGSQALVPAAAFAALAGAPPLARWLSAKTAPPWIRREVERRRREREAGGSSHASTPS
jgi:hypothetical protein